MNNRLVKLAHNYYCIFEGDEYFHFTPEEFKQFLTIVVKDILYEVKQEIRNQTSYDRFIEDAKFNENILIENIKDLYAIKW